MSHVFDSAPTSRAKCRGCETKIEKGEPRFGERQPNAFGDGEMTLWFHPLCAAYTRPAAVLEALVEQPLEAAAALRATAEFGVLHRRLPRLRGAERASSGRARCRSCREPIAKDSWRLRLMFVDDFPFQPAGFIHAGCAKGYFETAEIGDRIRHFSSEPNATELADIDAEVRAAGSNS